MCLNIELQKYNSRHLYIYLVYYGYKILEISWWNKLMVKSCDEQPLQM